MTPSILTKINCLQLQQYEKYACWMRMLFFCVVWMLYLRCRHQLDLSALLVALSDLYPSDLQTGAVVPCDPIARAFEEKDGFLVSGSPILLHDNYVLHQTRTIQQITDVRFWEKFELAGFHFA